MYVPKDVLTAVKNTTSESGSTIGTVIVARKGGSNYMRRSQRPGTTLKHEVEITNIHKMGNGFAGICTIDEQRKKVYRLPQHKYWNEKPPREFYGVHEGSNEKKEPVQVQVRKKRHVDVQPGDSVELHPVSNESRPVETFFSEYSQDDETLTFPMK